MGSSISAASTIITATMGNQSPQWGIRDCFSTGTLWSCSYSYHNLGKESSWLRKTSRTVRAFSILKEKGGVSFAAGFF